MGSFGMSRAKNWCFTINNHSGDDERRLNNGHDDMQYVIYGREIGDNGTPHLQGFVMFNRRLRMSQVKEYVGQRSHVEVARRVAESIAYCKKDGDFEEIGTMPGASQGQRSDLEAFKIAVQEGMTSLSEIRENHSAVYARYGAFVREYVNAHRPVISPDVHPLRPWQASLNTDLGRDADSRTVTFIVDLSGNGGKTWFAHYYVFLHPRDSQVLLPGRKQDMIFAFDEEKARVVFIDCPRSQNEFLQYGFMEELKNGYLWSPKYHSTIKRLSKPPHVVVMLNEHPDMTKLSADRYNVITI
jgi:hypothetical protein